MRRDHRPFWLKKLLSRWDEFYVQHFTRKHFDHLGRRPMIINPSTLEVHGSRISVGDCIYLLSKRYSPVRFTTWSGKGMQGKIEIGDYCLFSPGTVVSSAIGISIGNNCMFAADCYISDSDWHGLYNRLRPFRCSKPIVLEDNVWIGHGAKIGKGVTIGENSVVAAGSVVVKDVPPNTVVGGNPAKVIKTLNPDRRMLKREYMFSMGDYYWEQEDALNRYVLGGNTLRDWFRSLILPRADD